MPNLFNGVEFARMIDYQMHVRRMKQHQVCDQTGISRATLCRILSGKDPSIESYLRLKRWIALPAAPATDEGEALCTATTRSSAFMPAFKSSTQKW